MTFLFEVGAYVGGAILGGLVGNRRHPHIARWIKQDGWIEIGPGADRRYLARASSADGSIVWESQRAYRSIQEALDDLDEQLKPWVRV